MTEQRFKTTKFAAIMSYEAFCTLEKIYMERQSKQRYPTGLVEKFKRVKKDSELLASCMSMYIRSFAYSDCFGIKSTGTQQTDKETGESFYRQSKATTGISDYIAIYYGFVMFFEIKAGKDQMHDNQYKFEMRCEKAATPYRIVRTLDDAIVHFNELRVFVQSKNSYNLYASLPTRQKSKRDLKRISELNGNQDEFYGIFNGS